MGIDRTRLRWNGWGPVDGPDPLHGREGFWPLVAEAIGVPALRETPACALDAAELSPPLPPEAVARLEAAVGAGNVLTDRLDRASRARGKSYPDLLALRNGDLSTAPGAVVFPADASEVMALYAAAAELGLKLVPTGGGTSVVGGVTGPAETLWLSVDTARMDRLISIDETNLTATAGAGIDGPGLEAALNASGLTLGHFPQSFRHSTLGGWIAASGAGQQSGRYGRPFDWLVSAEVASPAGIWRTDPFPKSAAGPRLAPLVIGSEGVFGIVTEATVRVRRLPVVRNYRGYLFPDFKSGSDAIRAAVQAGTPAAMLRLSDADETRFLGAVSGLGKRQSLLRRAAGHWLRLRGAGTAPCLLIAGFEGTREETPAARAAAERHFRRHRAIAVGNAPGRSWYRSRFDGPALRDPLLGRGVGIDTLETATRWSNLQPLYRAVGEAIRAAIVRESPPGARPVVMTHVSHSYPEGASLYFTFLFPQRPGAELAQWQAIKQAAGDAIAANGGTISHHHGVGEDHRPWLAAEKGEIGVALLRAVRRRLDSDGLLNPGKLIP